MPSRTLEEDLLARAAEDWVSAAEVVHLVRRVGVEDPADARDLAIGLLARLIVGGLIVPGDFDDGGLSPWPIPPAEAIERIIAEWTAAPDPMVMPGAVVWVDTTPPGQRIGEAVLERERR